MDIDYPLLLYCVILYSGLLGNTVKHPHHVQIFLLAEHFRSIFTLVLDEPPSGESSTIT